MFTHIIYHKACPDGFASAYIAWKVLGNTPAYIPQSYYDKLPDIKNGKLLVCDFSFNEKETLKLIKQNESYYNIDHHKSAFENLENLDDKYKYFDINHSGAVLTWKYFFPEKEIPFFIKLIEDYDLWKFNYKETKPFMIALNEMNYNFKDWKQFEDHDFLLHFIEKGKILESYQSSLVNIACKCHKIIVHKINNEFYKVAYVNTNLFKNEIANKLVLETNCDFSITYNYDDAKNLTKFSLRSIDEKTDVGYIAKIIGGGGHRNAAGFTKSGIHKQII